MPKAPIASLLLDSYPNAAVAYSLRKLRSAYTGSAIRVRMVRVRRARVARGYKEKECIELKIYYLLVYNENK